MVLFLLFLIVGYLFGSLNFSIIFTRIFSNTDVREHGSGNAGFTNTLRVSGKKVAILVFACDALKAVAAIILAILYEKYFGNGSMATYYCRYFAGLGAVLGHNFPIYYGFKGGKGIVVSIALIFTFNWLAGCVVLASFLIIFAIKGYVSLGSLTGASVLLITEIVMISLGYGNVELAEVIFMGILTAFAFYTHRSNIIRLANGTENCFKKKKQEE